MKSSAIEIHVGVGLAMRTGLPSYHHYEYQREYEHCGTKQDWCVGYREPIKGHTDPLIHQKVKLSAYAIHDIEGQINLQIERSWNKAKKSPIVMQ